MASLAQLSDKLKVAIAGAELLAAEVAELRQENARLRVNLEQYKKRDQQLVTHLQSVQTTLNQTIDRLGLVPADHSVKDT